MCIVTVDSSGSVYATGRITGTLDGQSNSGSYDVLLLKYSALGDWQWTQVRGTSGDDRGYGGEPQMIVMFQLS